MSPSGTNKPANDVELPSFDKPQNISTSYLDWNTFSKAGVSITQTIVDYNIEKERRFYGYS